VGKIKYFLLSVEEALERRVWYARVYDGLVHGVEKKSEDVVS
jgi:hypothetical protein